MLLSIGGNDIGFCALAAYAITEHAADLAPIVQWIGSEVRFGPNVSRAYLNVLDERIAALKSALRDGFGVEPTGWCTRPTSRSSSTRTARFAGRSLCSAWTCIRNSGSAVNGWPRPRTF